METSLDVLDMSTVADSGSEPVVSVRGLSKRFLRADGSSVTAIDDVSFDVFPGEFVVLLGPSGCGKTTLLRAVAGLEKPDAGLVRIKDELVFSSEDGIEETPEHRPLSMVFQSYALWPHMTVFKNVAYPLESQRGSRSKGDEIGARVRRVLEMVGIPELEQQHPHQLSGGQQQRVALARALVRGDDLILFDEPLSNVDAKVREQLRFELLSMQRELGFSALFVTHDQAEAMELGHRIAVLQEGHVEQFGRPYDIYNQPASRYVANFIGATNELVGAVLSAANGELVVDTPIGEVVAASIGVDFEPGKVVAAFWRPERCVASKDMPDARNKWEGVVRAPLFLGSHTEYVVEIENGKRLRLWSPRSDIIAEGAPVWVSVDPADVYVLDAGGSLPQTESREPELRGDTVR